MIWWRKRCTFVPSTDHNLICVYSIATQCCIRNLYYSWFEYWIVCVHLRFRHADYSWTINLRAQFLLGSSHTCGVRNQSSKQHIHLFENKETEKKLPTYNLQRIFSVLFTSVGLATEIEVALTIEWRIVQFVHAPFQWKLVIILILYFMCVLCVAVHKFSFTHAVNFSTEWCGGGSFPPMSTLVTCFHFASGFVLIARIFVI